VIPRYWILDAPLMAWIQQKFQVRKLIQQLAESSNKIVVNFHAYSLKRESSAVCAARV